MIIVFLIQKNLLPFHHFLKCRKKSYPPGDCTLYPKMTVRTSRKGKRVDSRNPDAVEQGPTSACSLHGGRSSRREQSSFLSSLDGPVAQRHPFKMPHRVINVDFTSAVLGESSSGEERVITSAGGVARGRWHRATSSQRAQCWRLRAVRGFISARQRA